MNSNNRTIRYLAWTTGLYGIFTVVRSVAFYIYGIIYLIKYFGLKQDLLSLLTLIAAAGTLRGIGFAGRAVSIHKRAPLTRKLLLWLAFFDLWAPLLLYATIAQVPNLGPVYYKGITALYIVFEQLIRLAVVVFTAVSLNIASIEQEFAEFEGDVKGHVNRIVENIRTWGDDPKFRRSWLSSFTIHFLIIFGPLILIYFGACDEYKIPAGGGKQKPRIAVKIKKVKKKKRLVNPYSSILFHPPPLQKVNLQLEELTQQRYQVGIGGRGEGKTPGFGKGIPGGKIRFIRLEYSGKGWDHNMGVDADNNMLLEFYKRTQVPVHRETESKTLYEIRRFRSGRKPPFLYMTGTGDISMSGYEKKILRKYLVEEHGMLFADNAGGSFHASFMSLMKEVIGEVPYAPVPVDDELYKCYYIIPGGAPPVQLHASVGDKRSALGWKTRGRWIVYYHMGDIADAWKTGHSGFGDQVAELSYMTGVNIIYYAVIKYLDGIKPD
ncbi:DUF4159 domain-containing protein [Planctomycetota bacterium]